MRQRVHPAVTGTPHCSQNRAPSGLSWRQAVQRMGSLFRLDVLDAAGTGARGEAHCPTLIPAERIARSIVVLRGRRVLLDTELAALYGVETRVLVQSVKRNPERFPGDFRFRLSPAEAESLRSQIVISKGRGGRRYAPYAFTEQGVAMLSGVLNSPRAIAAKVEIMRARFRPAAPDDRIPRPPGTQAGRAGKAVRRAVQGCLRRHPRAHGSATSQGEALRIPVRGRAHLIGRLGIAVIGVRASRLTSIGSPSPPPQVIGVAST